jgi:hypothetical protein
MPYYEWKGDGQFTDNQNNRVIERGEVVELSESVAGRFDFVEVDAPSSEGQCPDSDGEDTDAESYQCGVNGCSREVDSEDATCWQHGE